MRHRVGTGYNEFILHIAQPVGATYKYGGMVEWCNYEVLQILNRLYQSSNEAPYMIDLRR